jgi:hypothetical protein
MRILIAGGARFVRGFRNGELGAFFSVLPCHLGWRHPVRDRVSLIMAQQANGPE